MYALFERIAQGELQSSDDAFSDPCDAEKTTVIITKVFRKLKTYVGIENESSASALINNGNASDEYFRYLSKREVSPSNVTRLFGNQTSSQEECWETGVGQELAKLIVFDMYTVVLSILIFGKGQNYYSTSSTV